MRHGSLFSGIGGFDLAAQWVGWENVFQVEIDSFCQKVLKKNFPNTLRYSDIHNVTVDNYGNLLYLCENGDIQMGQKRLAKYDNAVQLYESGMSIQECAEFYEISRQAMHKILKRRGCKFRPNLKYGEDNHFHRGAYFDNEKKKDWKHEVGFGDIRWQRNFDTIAEGIKWYAETKEEYLDLVGVLKQMHDNYIKYIQQRSIGDDEWKPNEPEKEKIKTSISDYEDDIL